MCTKGSQVRDRSVLSARSALQARRRLAPLSLVRQCRPIIHRRWRVLRAHDLLPARPSALGLQEPPPRARAGAQFFGAPGSTPLGSGHAGHLLAQYGGWRLTVEG
eukprot:234353-Alexandrium_andersonii.AAC.1